VAVLLVRFLKTADKNFNKLKAERISEKKEILKKERHDKYEQDLKEMQKEQERESLTKKPTQPNELMGPPDKESKVSTRYVTQDDDIYESKRSNPDVIFNDPRAAEINSVVQIQSDKQTNAQKTNNAAFGGHSKNKEMNF